MCARDRPPLPRPTNRRNPRLRRRPDDARALTAIKGVRDITSGVVPMVVWAVAGVPALGWALIAASITPWADMGIVLARDGRRTAAFGIHGLTAALLVVAGAALVASG
jgi:hypothetical protein